MRGAHDGYAKISYVTTGEQSYNSLCSSREEPPHATANPMQAPGEDLNQTICRICKVQVQ